MLEVPQKAAEYAARHSLPPMPMDALAILDVAALSTTTGVVEQCAAQVVEPCDEGVEVIQHVTSGGRKYSTFIYHGVTYRSKAAYLRASRLRPTLQSKAARKKGVPRPRTAVVRLPATVWSPTHCEVSKCTLDIGHQGPHTCDLPAVPLQLLRKRRGL